MGNFKEDIARTEAFFFDVDGVFTDGGITPTLQGDVERTYYAKDGYAVAYALKEGYKVFIITGGHGDSLKNRFEYLKVTELHLEARDKVKLIKEIIARYNFNPENLVYMGDDIPDLECMQLVGLPVCPADAASEVMEASRYVSEYEGGRGCVRDIIEQVLRCQGNWAKHLKGVTGVTSE